MRIYWNITVTKIKKKKLTFLYFKENKTINYILSLPFELIQHDIWPLSSKQQLVQIKE